MQLTSSVLRSVKSEQINIQFDGESSTDAGRNSGLLYTCLNNLAASAKQFRLKRKQDLHGK